MLLFVRRAGSSSSFLPEDGTHTFVARDPLSNPNGPLDHDLFLLCERETVKLLRNHPCLTLWVGGNEQTPRDEALEEDLRLHPLFESFTSYNNCVEEINLKVKDPSTYLDGTRVYIKGLCGTNFLMGKGVLRMALIKSKTLGTSSGQIFHYGFNPEVGSVGIPVADTIQTTMR
ncbi:beta-mannosidase [Striga asiatica]|uniref:Beta-mannosidase n=1 Tax=Striga asiatica TaxID=4170 RepID=A0A5A7QWI7_STRAF|nr:beta-mannosidase [Striga asiatica]